MTLHNMRSTSHMRSTINKRNARILSKLNTTNTNSEEPNCNCWTKDNCPLQGNCLTKNLVYQAEVTTTDNVTTTKIYRDDCKIKACYNNHMKSFRDAEDSRETTLSSNIWKLNMEKRGYSIKWSILKRAKSYESGKKLCNLCLEGIIGTISSRRSRATDGCLGRRSLGRGQRWWLEKSSLSSALATPPTSHLMLSLVVPWWLFWKLIMTVFQAIRDMLLLSYDSGYISWKELLILLEEYNSKNPAFPFDKNNRFDLGSVEEPDCKYEFRVEKPDIRLMAAEIELKHCTSSHG